MAILLTLPLLVKFIAAIIVVGVFIKLGNDYYNATSISSSIVSSSTPSSVSSVTASSSNPPPISSSESIRAEEAAMTANEIAASEVSGTTSESSQPVPVDCTFSDWSNWSSCDGPCDSESTQERTRTIVTPASNGGVCGETSQSRGCTTVECPTECEMSAWSNWTACDGGCGTNSVQRRSRSIITPAANGAAACGELEQTRGCINDPCPVNCATSDWGPWGSCRGSCNTQGTQLRSRTIVQEAEHGGAICGPLDEVRSCLNDPCPVDCRLSSWSDWSTCSGSCGGDGIQRRTRTVLEQPRYGGVPCEMLEETRACTNPPCPVHCETTPWSAYSTCSGSCGTIGQQYRTREVIKHPRNGGAPCGALESYRDCANPPCPVNCEMTPWSTYSECPATCGQGKTYRTRSVAIEPKYGGMPCPPGRTEMEVCHKSVCANPIKMGDISKLKHTTNTYGAVVFKQRMTFTGALKVLRIQTTASKLQGYQDALDSNWMLGIYVRDIYSVNPKFKLVHTYALPVFEASPDRIITFNIPNDDIYVEAGMYVGLYKFFTSGMTIMLDQETQVPSSEFFIEAYTNVSGDIWKDTNGYIMADAIWKPLPVRPYEFEYSIHKKQDNCVFSSWSPWTECDAICGASGTQERHRVVLIPPKHADIVGCKSSLKDIRVCEVSDCAVDCRVSDWSDWTTCPETCGDNVQTRTRTITQMPSSNGQACPSLEESRQCFNSDCNEEYEFGWYPVDMYGNYNSATSSRWGPYHILRPFVSVNSYVTKLRIGGFEKNLQAAQADPGSRNNWHFVIYRNKNASPTVTENEPQFDVVKMISLPAPTEVLPDLWQYDLTDPIHVPIGMYIGVYGYMFFKSAGREQGYVTENGNVFDYTSIARTEEGAYNYASFTPALVVNIQTTDYTADCRETLWSKWTKCSGVCGGKPGKQMRSRLRMFNGVCLPHWEERNCVSEPCQGVVTLGSLKGIHSSHASRGHTVIAERLPFSGNLLNLKIRGGTYYHKIMTDKTSPNFQFAKYKLTGYSDDFRYHPIFEVTDVYPLPTPGLELQQGDTFQSVTYDLSSNPISLSVGDYIGLYISDYSDASTALGAGGLDESDTHVKVYSKWTDIMPWVPKNVGIAYTIDIVQ